LDRYFDIFDVIPISSDDRSLLNGFNPQGTQSITTDEFKIACKDVEGLSTKQLRKLVETGK